MNKDITLDKYSLEKESSVSTSGAQSCVECVSVAELPVELDWNSCANHKEREDEEGRVTPLVQDIEEEEKIDKRKNSLDSKIEECHYHHYKEHQC